MTSFVGLGCMSFGMIDGTKKVESDCVEKQSNEVRSVVLKINICSPLDLHPSMTHITSFTIEIVSINLAKMLGAAILLVLSL